jgi:hypothetical protein
LLHKPTLRFLFTQIIFPAFSGSASFFARREEQCENDVKENVSLNTQQWLNLLRHKNLVETLNCGTASVSNFIFSIEDKLALNS